MKAYANPPVRTTTRTTVTAPAAARPLEHIAVSAAARLGAIACGLAWLFAAFAAFVFDVFGVNLWLTVFQARWVTTSGWESLPVFMAEFGGLVTGVLGATLLGGLVGALTAWTYNFTTAPAEEYDD
jgi:hypothetical protein